MSLAQRCGAHGAARDAACARLLQRVREEGLHSVRIVWGDLHGMYRSKTLVGDADGLAGALAGALHDGIGMVSTLLLKDTSDRTAFPLFEPGALDAVPGFQAANNLLLLPDPSSLTPLPWADGTAWLRAEPWWPDGSAVAVDPRRVLQAALAALAAQGYGLRCGLEVEFHIYRIGGGLQGPDTAAGAAHGNGNGNAHADAGDAADAAAWPAEPPPLRLIHPGYQLLADGAADLADAALAIVRRTALGLGLPLRSLEIELGPSQVEAVFSPTDALTAADQMLQFRNGVRQALRRAGYHASFACRPPFANAVASGWHLHQSLVHLQGEVPGTNAMQRAAPAGQGAAGDARQVLSDAGAHWLAGLLAHARGMAALCAPTIAAYGRFRGSVMAPQAAVWGHDNRGAMLRVLGGCGDGATRIENRIAEPMANPYLCMAAQVLAGLDGLQRQLQPPPASALPYAASAVRQAPLPASLAEALDALDADLCLQQGLGAPMACVFSTVKRQELARHAQADDKVAWERREYLGRF